ncbi:MAG: diacylglycerol/lipid kinase family protein [Candidatus Izemoplasmataceae bacterium]
MKRCWVIYNPMSGKKKFADHIDLVKETIEVLGYKVYIKETKRPRHATEIVKEACYDKVEMILISGGDGTVNECVNGLAESQHQPLIAYIPSGTACDIAKTLGIPKNVPKALNIIKQMHEVKMDIVKGAHEYFVYVTALGNYVDISYLTHSKLKRKLGYLAYFITGVKEFFTIPMIKTEINYDQGVLKGYYSLIMVVNSKRVAGFNIIQKPVLDDGLVDIVLYRYIPLLNNIIYFFSFFFNPKILPFVKKIRTKEATIYTEHHHRWNIDGEASDSGNQSIKVFKQKLRILINPDQSDKYFKNQKDSHV